MIKLPSGVDINNLIDDIRIFSWEAADILLYYSNLLEDKDDKKNIVIRYCQSYLDIEFLIAISSLVLP